MQTTTRMMGSNSVIMILAQDGKEIGRTRNERTARAMARKALGCDRVSRWEEADGYCLFPTGEDEDTESVVRVVYAGSPERRI